MAKIGAPKITITFKTKSISAIERSMRGVVMMILKNEPTDTTNYFKVGDVTDIPDAGLTDGNIDLIKKCLLGTPNKVLVYTIPTDDVADAVNTQSKILAQVANIKFNYICAPTGSAQDQEDLASWIKTQRNVKDKTFKAVVANTEADDKGVINFCTGDIKVLNPNYTASESDTSTVAVGTFNVGDTVVGGEEEFLTYTATQYTARIAGILAGLPLDRACTYYQLNEVVSCEKYEDVDAEVDQGHLILFDEEDDEGVKIVRGVNSLTTFTTDVGQDFRYIKIVEAIDMIHDDIKDTFKSDYVGKVINDYDHKMAFINAVLIYFDGLKGNVLDASPSVVNTVDIDENAQINYIKLHNLDDPSKLTTQQIREYNTGTNVFLTGRITPVNAMEDLTINFLM